MGSRKSKCRQKSLWEELEGLLEGVLDFVICIYLILMLAVFPFYNEEGYSHIGTDKSAFFCRVGLETGKFLVLPLLFCMVLKVANRIGKKPLRHAGKMQVKISATDIFAMVYCGALLLSYIFTDYKQEALWGARGWYMGLFPQIMLVCVYFLVSRFWKPRKWLFYIVFPVSGAVFLMGCMNRFGFYFFGPEFVEAAYISTIGNINWYCGYAVSVMFAGTVLVWLGEEGTWKKALLLIYTGVGYLSLILQGSDSGLVALAVVMLVMFRMSAGEGGRMLAFWRQMTLLWGGCLVLSLVRRIFPHRINFEGRLELLFTDGPVCYIAAFVSVLCLVWVWADRRRGIYREKLFRILTGTAVAASAAAVVGALCMGMANTLHPGILGKLSENSLFTFNAAWGSSRGATWSAGWNCFAAQNALHKLVGVGPDCMWSYISSGASPGLLASVKGVFGDLRLTNAHCEWLTVLVDTGIMGLAGYAGMIICGIREMLGNGRKYPVVAACGFCLLAYTVNGIFSFQQSMGAGTVFLMFGMGKAFLDKTRK